MKHTCKLIATLVAILNYSIGEAQNPIVQTKYSADPAPMVYKGKVYLYTSHDEDDANADGKGFKMLDW
jgi:hypothetical protein